MPSEDALSAVGRRDTRADMVRERRISGQLLLAALGIVYGDIGTSPLYAFRQALGGAPHSIAVAQHALGCASLIFWTLIIAATVKYVTIVLRATDQGEGGIVTLTSLASNSLPSERWRNHTLIIGLVGIALFYGDCVLTPAISVLSALEGLQITTPLLEPYIVPIAIVILALLFIVQKSGTARLGAFLGPVMAAWFLLLAGAGAFHIARQPDVLMAANPLYALGLLRSLGWSSAFTLGAVFLAVTGAEALYADVGHFSKRIVRMNWFALVLPALTLSYFGQAALVLRHPEAAVNPFYGQFDEVLLYPAIALATAATIIASQAVITGAFTLSLQAMHLRLIPRLETRFTSKTHMGQVYVPEVNWALAFAVILTVLHFQSSAKLAGAYGLAVSTTMVVTTLLVGIVAIFRWRWPVWMVIPLFGGFLLIDLAFFGASALKIVDGGWFPIAIGCLVFIIMRTWRQGRDTILARFAEENGTVEAFWQKMHCESLPRVAGTAIYLTSRADAAPSALAVQVRHNRCLHRTVILLTVVTERIPRVSTSRQVMFEPLHQGLIRAKLRFGFSEVPDVPRALARLPDFPYIDDDTLTTYFTGREIPVASERADLAAWQEPIFLLLTKFSANAADYFCLPPKQCVELATKIEI